VLISSALRVDNPLRGKRRSATVLAAICIYEMLQLQPIGPIPLGTARVAHAAIPEGNTYLTLRNSLGTIFDDVMFASLFPSRGQPAAAPWRLALVTILQFAEGVSDPDAADAVRTQIDWKSLLGASIRNMNRLELVEETLRAALNVLATADPAWLSANIDSEGVRSLGLREEFRQLVGDVKMAAGRVYQKLQSVTFPKMVTSMQRSPQFRPANVLWLAGMSQREDVGFSPAFQGLESRLKLPRATTCAV
jgi:Transposase domain (DUF772)